jgi:hypothetical protein
MFIPRHSSFLIKLGPNPAELGPNARSMSITLETKPLHGLEIGEISIFAT